MGGESSAIWHKTLSDKPQNSHGVITIGRDEIQVLQIP